MSREEILAKVESLPALPIAFQALWDGDTFDDWFIWISAIMDGKSSHSLGRIAREEAGEFADASTHHWPQAQLAQKIGKELAERYGVEFYFPSPDHPEDDCPDWQHRHQGYSCRRCGILLLQEEHIPWRGICYFCHLEEEREKKEALLTEEERAGPRCHICGKPAKHEFFNGPVCIECFDKYDNYRCEQCDCICMVCKTVAHTSLCGRCQARTTVASLTPSQRQIILEAIADSQFFAMDTAIEVSGCSSVEARHVIHLLCNPTD